MDREITELMRFVKSITILLIGGLIGTALLYAAMYFMLLAKLAELQ